MPRMTLLLSVMLCLTGCGSLTNHPVVTAAKEEVSKNHRVADALGGPVQFSPTVTGRANETDGLAAMQFEAKGSRAVGTVVVEGRKLGKDWGVTLLEVRPAGGGTTLALTAEAAERMGVDTPKFDPSATPTTSSAAPPPGEIEITIPAGGPAG